jgi:transcriptional regulator with XRE-family HTH domain
MMRIEIDGQRRRGRPGSGAFDAALGARIRERRITLGLTQIALAHVLGITYQQVWKYEHGVNRIAGQRLFDIATALNVTVEELTGSTDETELAVAHRKMLNLVVAYRKLSPQHQVAVRALIFRLVP